MKERKNKRKKERKKERKTGGLKFEAKSRNLKRAALLNLSCF